MILRVTLLTRGAHQKGYATDVDVSLSSNGVCTLNCDALGI